MPTSDIGAVAGAVQSVSDLVGSILNRADRDEPDNTAQSQLVTLQNAYASNDLDSDAFRLFVDELFNKAGHPLTPTRDVSTGRREFQHTALVCIIQLIQERELAKRAFAKLTKI